MRIVLTGASGFVGRATCKRLLGAGHRVTATVRDANSARGLSAHEVIALGNLTGHTDWSAALEGAEAIVHLAGRTHVTDEVAVAAERNYRQANVEVTCGLAQAALRAGVRRFVFVSSIKVNGESTDGVPFTAQTPISPKDWYGKTKADAELMLLGLAPRGLEVVVLRPPLIYGPGLKGNMARLFALADRGIPVPFASIANARDLLALGSLADLIAHVVSHPAAAGKVFLACDGRPVATPELFRSIAGALGRSARVLPMPITILRLVGEVMGRSAQIERLVGDLEIDDRATRELLAWAPPISMENALMETACWWKSRGSRAN